MTERGLLLIAVSAVSTMAANLTLRAGVTRAGGVTLSADRIVGDLVNLARQPLFLVGFALYVTAAVVWFHVISTEKLNTSYPILVSLTFVLVTLGAMVFFHEPLSWQKIVGLSVILVGITLVASA